MDRLPTELQRLYLTPAPADGQPLLTPDGRTRALVLELARPPDWTALAALWAAVQDDLELPAPALAVSGVDGGQLWLALADPVPAAEAHRFLQALVRRYLPEAPAARLRCWPTPPDGPNGLRHAAPVPADQGGRWSAFVAPGLAPMFADDPWLDTPPNPEAQADLLARLRPAAPAAWRQAWARLHPAPETAVPAPTQAPQTAPTADLWTEAPLDGEPSLGVHTDPRAFLLAVMNAPHVPLPWRLEAAKTLLAHRTAVSA
ncbi:hypothetical protein [Aquabacterium sp. A08]|uniref:hypothetical protein n=1 Tax=Aquabacterium sp. A08 TaxID=2718532 RepID=UPI0014205E01|nr:hypothetical protein [Aquabacterium sp. A08]NIC42866.1 hypothetical protein [Aquabacterium sp. A08]